MKDRARTSSYLKYSRPEELPKHTMYVVSPLTLCTLALQRLPEHLGTELSRYFLEKQ